MNDISNDTVSEFFKSHPAMVMTLLFLQVSAVGLIYDYSLLKEFGVNLFLFAEANDFFLAGFKDPFVLFQSVITLLVFVPFLLLSPRIRMFKRITEEKSTFYPVMAITIVVYTLLPPYLGGKQAAKTVFEDKNAITGIFLNRKTVPKLIASDSDSFYLITTTDKFAFFYEENSKAVKVLSLATLAGFSKKSALTKPSS